MSTAWDALNDNVTQAQGSIPVEDFLYAHNLNQVTEVALSTVTLGTTTPSAGKAWFYMDTGPGQTVRADVLWGGTVRGTTTVPASSNYAWRSINVLPPDQASVDDLRIRFTVSTAGSGSADIFATYFELTTTAGSGPPPRTLTVTPPTGTGSGTITGTGINCPGDCSETYADGTAVTLSANPAAGSTFAGWSGACSGTGSCALTMNADKTVSGSFTSSAPPQRTLTVTPPTGTGGGSITGTGINCPGDCSEAYADGTAVTLSANPAAGSTFAGWTGACSGTGSCALTMNADKTVSGSFTATGGGGGTQLLRPNGDVTSQWTVSGVSTAWDALNESVTWTQTSIPVENFLYAHNLNRVTEVALSTVTLGATTPTAGKAWFYMDTGPGQSVRADVIWGGAVRGTTTVPAASNYAWRSISVRPAKPGRG